MTREQVEQSCGREDVGSQCILLSYCVQIYSNNNKEQKEYKSLKLLYLQEVSDDRAVRAGVSVT